MGSGLSRGRGPRFAESRDGRSRLVHDLRQVRELPRDECLIWAEGTRGVIRAKRIPYYKLPEFSGFRPDPYEKGKKHGGRIEVLRPATVTRGWIARSSAGGVREVHMSGNELEELLDENQRMRNQRKWGLVGLGLVAGAVAWGMYGHTAKAGVEAAKHAVALPLWKQDVSSARVARPSPPVIPQENTEAQEQEEVAEDDPPPAPAPDAEQPVATPATPTADTAASPSTGTMSGALSFNVWKDYRGQDGYRAFGFHPYGAGYAPYRGGLNRPGAYRSGARPSPAHAPAPFRGAVRSPGARSFAAARSFGGGGRR
jgi:hypothetical protein